MNRNNLDRRSLTPETTELVESLWNHPELEGRRIEVMHGKFVIAPLLDADHVIALTELMDLFAHAGAREHGLRVVQGIRLSLAEGEYAVPDLCVVDGDFRTRKLPDGTHSPGVFQLVVEITSSNWQDDLRIKPDVYATAGVPVYLVGDREHGEARLLWRPEAGEYRSVATYQPGEVCVPPGDFPVEIPVDALLRQ